MPTELERTRQALEREKRSLDHRRAEFEQAMLRVSDLRRQVDAVESSVTRMQQRLDELEEIVALRAENERLRQQVVECNNVHNAPF